MRFFFRHGIKAGGEGWGGEREGREERKSPKEPFSDSCGKGHSLMKISSTTLSGFHVQQFSLCVVERIKEKMAQSHLFIQYSCWRIKVIFRKLVL